MSNQTPQSPTTIEEPADRRKVFGKYVKRLSSVLRRGSSKDVVPRSAPAEPLVQEVETIPIPAPVVVPVEKTTDQYKPTAEVLQHLAPLTGLPMSPGPYSKTTLQQERARAVFARYGLTLDTHEWLTAGVTSGTVQRVEKPIRMRIHRKCHKCEATFGVDRICKSCEHRRCKKCPRWPPKKEDAGKTEIPFKEKTARNEAEELVSEYKKRRKNNTPHLTVTSKSGTELIYSPPRQRIRRTCHKCSNMFQPVTAAVCQSCNHHRCTQCPRDPAKKTKWPDGYPGDDPMSDPEFDFPTINRTWKRPRQRVRWTCCTCQGLFKDGLRTCACGHERTDCHGCTRTPSIRPKEDFSPELVAAVEQKLRLKFKLEGVPSTNVPPPPP